MDADLGACPSLNSPLLKALLPSYFHPEELRILLRWSSLTTGSDGLNEKTHCVSFNLGSDGMIDWPKGESKVGRVDGPRAEDYLISARLDKNESNRIGSWQHTRRLKQQQYSSGERPAKADGLGQ